MRARAAHLKPGGIFGLWANETPDESFTRILSTVFAAAWASPVTFPNPFQDRPVTQAIYLARAARASIATS